MLKKILNTGVFLSLLTLNISAQIPKIIEKDGHHALLVDGKPFFILGGQAHNSSGWPAMMPELFSAVKAMHLNTVEIPIYWEQVEAQPGKFDFSLVDTLLARARTFQVHLVILWFGTWKNGSNHYMPEWMKREAVKYPNITGSNGQDVDSPSPIAKATLAADINAFTKIMHYLKETDPQHTVIMVQVENESGAWGSVRDYSPAAQKLFESAVPSRLLQPELLKTLNVPVATSGNWKQVFGNRADEYFQAWSVASFVGEVTAAGKAAYPLPMYVNCALREPFGNPTANHYESGGPTDNVIPIWKAAAPAIDLLAPDIYLQGSDTILKVIQLYNRPDNPLFVPEVALLPINAKYLYQVIAAGGIGYSPFGIDDNVPEAQPAETSKRLAAFSNEYLILIPMIRELAEWAFEGRVKTAIEREDHAGQSIDLGAWKAVVSFGIARRNTILADKEPNGKIMIVQLDTSRFILIGNLCHITFQPTAQHAGSPWQYLKVEEGSYENGSFKTLRILNGDETDFGGPRFGAVPIVMRVELILR